MGDTSKIDFIDEFEKEIAESIRLYIHDETKSWGDWYSLDIKMQSDLGKYREWTNKIDSQESFTKEDADFLYDAKIRLDLLQEIILWFKSQPTGFRKDKETLLLDKQARQERAVQFKKELNFNLLPHIRNAFKGHTVESILRFAEEQSLIKSLDEKIRNYWAIDLLMDYCNLTRLAAVETLQKEWKTLPNRKEESSKKQFAKERTKYRHLFPKSTP